MSAERRVAWLDDGRRVGEFTVAPEWKSFVLSLGSLAAGGHTLTLACLEPAVAADALLHNGDRRALAVAVGSWRIRDAEGAARTDRGPAPGPRAWAQRRGR
jgi:hypothetical protein